MKTNIIVKTDKEIKKKAAQLAEEVGLTLSDIVNISLRKFVETGTLTVSIAPRMSKKLERVIAKAEKELAAERVQSANSVENFIKTLHS